MTTDEPQAIMCKEPQCTGNGSRPAEGVTAGHVHTIFACQECADRAGVELMPIPGGNPPNTSGE